MMFFLFVPLVSAQDQQTDNCSILNDPAQQKGKIITILEERISAATEEQAKSEGKQIINCFRETTCGAASQEGTSETTQPQAETQEETSETTQPEGETTQQGAGTQTGPECTSKYVSTCTPKENVFCQSVQAIIAESGISLLMVYLGLIYRWAAAVIGIVSVAYMVWGGIMIATAQDDTTAIDKAKEKILQSIAGLILLFLSAIILYTINPNFFTF